MKDMNIRRDLLEFEDTSSEEGSAEEYFHSIMSTKLNTSQNTTANGQARQLEALTQPSA